MDRTRGRGERQLVERHGHRPGHRHQHHQLRAAAAAQRPGEGRQGGPPFFEVEVESPGHHQADPRRLERRRQLAHQRHRDERRQRGRQRQQGYGEREGRSRQGLDEGDVGDHVEDDRAQGREPVSAGEPRSRVEDDPDHEDQRLRQCQQEEQGHRRKRAHEELAQQVEDRPAEAGAEDDEESGERQGHTRPRSLLRYALAMSQLPDFACPECRTRLERRGAKTLRCPADGELYREVSGIWRFLGERRREELRGFLTRYATVRRDEGWGDDDPAYYRALPYRDLSGRHPEIWRIRALTYRALLRRVLRPAAAGGLSILDLGAGNGWLSYRLRQEGHVPVAVDVTVDRRDGLGACRHYPERFLRVEASFDRLPWAAPELDVAIFNGSLHYSRDCAATLREALRLLKPGGRLVVMDTPIYRRRSSGERMLRELEARLRERYGFAREGGGVGFLTPEHLDRLARELGLEWRVIRPFYGLRWALIPWKARLLGRRELMRFRLLLARRPLPSDTTNGESDV